MLDTEIEHQSITIPETIDMCSKIITHRSTTTFESISSKQICLILINCWCSTATYEWKSIIKAITTPLKFSDLICQLVFQIWDCSRYSRSVSKIFMPKANPFLPLLMLMRLLIPESRVACSSYDGLLTTWYIHYIGTRQ